MFHNIEIAFYYNPNNYQLYDDIEYRVATDRERINYEKQIINGFEPLTDYNKYIKSKSNLVSANHKSRSEELSYFRTLTNLHKTKGKEK